MLMLMRLLLCLIMINIASLLDFMVKFEKLHYYSILFCLRQLLFSFMLLLFDLLKGEAHDFK